MDILKLITDQINDPNTLNKLSQSVGADPSQVQQLAKIGMPALLQALGRNASTTEGAESLAGALDQHQDDNVTDSEGVFNNANSEDGAKMLQHIFAGNNDQVQSNLATQTGLETSQVSSIMAQLAPFLLGALGQQKKQENLDASGLAGMLSGLLSQGSSSGWMGMVTNMLDADKDGDIMDDVGDLVGRFFKK